MTGLWLLKHRCSLDDEKCGLAMWIVLKALHSAPVCGVGIKNRAGFFEKKAVKAALQHARVVFATCAGAGSSQVLLQQYAVAIIDEASQVSMRLCQGPELLEAPFHTIGTACTS